MYAKIFDSMYEGTLYGHWEAIVTFQQMLILCDSSGVIDMTPEVISGKTSIPIEIIRKGIEELMAPDPQSRTPGEDGKRIALIDDHRNWGWYVVNHRKYRDLRSAEEKREADRIRIAEKRSAAKDLAGCRDVSRLSPTQTHTHTHTQEELLGEPALAGSPPELSALPQSAVPYQRIVGYFNETMLNLPKVRELTTKRRNLIRAAWNASSSRKDLAFWKAYFEECADDAFLNGTGPYRNGHENWRPSFDFILRPETITGVYEKALDRLERSESRTTR